MRLIVRVVVALDILFVVGMLAIVLHGLSNITTFNDRLDKWIFLAQVVGLLGALGTLLVLYDAIQSSLSKGKRIWSKLYSTALAFGCLGFLWFLFAENLLRFTARY